MRKDNPLAIKLTSVSKKYEIHHEKPTLIEKIVQKREAANGETFWALKDINITIHKGEKVGIIGPNGSGKTTLLKIIAGITAPTTGTIWTEGKIVSLIDLEAGFQEDLTGIQNIYLNGMLLGIHRAEIDANLSRIISFADIHQFIDVPLYTYSAGMKLRLGFSVAIHSNPDILILDEGMGVGDAKFKTKAQYVLKRFIDKKKTFIMATHWIDFIQSNCDRIISLHHGKARGVREYANESKRNRSMYA